MYKHIKISFVAILGLFQMGWSQDDEKDIGTETVTVVKAYAPTISDAFKVKSVPTLNDSIVLQKKPIQYSIFSVPVASTFTPAKGKASGVKKKPREKIFNSYAAVGLGNYSNALLDFYTSRALNRDERLDLSLNHHSSRGDVKGTALNTIFYNTQIEANYTKKQRDLSWGANMGVQHQLYNWYGIPNGYYTEELVNGIDEKQNYFNAFVGGFVDVEDSFFKRAEVFYRRFWDATKSGENRAMLKPSFKFPLGDEMLTLNAKVDYIGGKFTNAQLSNDSNMPGINYSHLQVGINPSINILRDELSLHLGVNLVYGMDLEKSESNFYIYPAVTASYRLLDEVAIAYGGIEGELRQNSFYGFVEDNPYVSPTLIIQPTDQQYNAYVGLKGQLLPNLSYNLKGSYGAENRKPLFLLNPENTYRTDDKGYFYGNSFQVFYDDVKTLGIFGELNVDVNRNFSLGVNAQVYDYDTETDNSAWNLPGLTAAAFMDYQIGEQWYVGANLFYVGERDDLYTIATPGALLEDFNMISITLDSYFDANAHIGYRVNEQLSVFVKANNIANQNYMRWNNYNVQGFQILAGATYKFDF